MWFRGFFENGQPQSMSDLIAYTLVVSGVVYAFVYASASESVVIISIGAGLKGYKNYEGRKRKQIETNNLDIERVNSDSIHNESRD